MVPVQIIPGNVSSFDMLPKFNINRVLDLFGGDDILLSRVAAWLILPGTELAFSVSCAVVVALRNQK